jgi:galactokinase
MTRHYVVPGRVELVGKHVDYAGGRSLTCATEQSIHARVEVLAEPLLRVRDATCREFVEAPLAPDARGTGPAWGKYALAVARRFSRDFPRAQRGADVILESLVPASAGLSSSSALVVALALALFDANEMQDDPEWREYVPTDIARAEYVAAIETGAPFGPFAGDEGVGVRGGAQDQVAILCAQAGMIGQFSYLPPRRERYVPWPADHVIAIGVSGVHASKAGNARTAYNRLSDAMREVGRSGAPVAPTPELAARVAQFQEETAVIVPGVADALRDRDFRLLGALVDRSQALAEQVLGNQVRETVSLARMAREWGAVAASAFGAGFGGAVWAMVARDDADRFLAAWRAEYDRAFPSRKARAKWLLTSPAGPAHRTDQGA